MLFALGCGAATVFAFAPFFVTWLPIVTLGALFLPGMREIERGDAPLPPSGRRPLPLARRVVPGNPPA